MMIQPTRINRAIVTIQNGEHRTRRHASTSALRPDARSTAAELGSMSVLFVA